MGIFTVQLHTACGVQPVDAVYNGFGVCLIHGNGRCGSIAGIVGNAYHIQVTLQLAIFAGRAMHSYKGKVELDLLPRYSKAEVVFIYVDVFMAGIIKPAIAVN